MFATLATPRPRSSMPAATMLALAALLVLVAFAEPARAFDAALLAEIEHVPGEILVSFHEAAPFAAREAALASLAIVDRQARTSLGYEKLTLAAGASLDAALTALEADPSVAWVEPNWVRYAVTSGPGDPFLRDLPATVNQWGIFKTGVQSLWRSGGGGDSTVIIGIVDTGIDNYASPHGDLAANVMNGAGNGRDFVPAAPDNDPTDEGAFRGHGTQVAGVAAAPADGQGMVGVAYRSRMKFVRVLDCNFAGCTGNADRTARGIEWAANNGCRVINLSLGGGGYSDAERVAILGAIKQKAIVIAASGNDSLAVLKFPAAYPEVIAVGATEPDDDVVAFSSSGAGLDLVAPGVDIWTTSIPGYTIVDGTSFAAPFVSGVAALVAARNPAITHQEMTDYLVKHTKPLADAARDGAGRTDFVTLEDWSDHPDFYASARHKNYFWEWLGEDATHETATSDTADTDGQPNFDMSDLYAHDMADDGAFPASFSELPYLPPHLGGPTKGVTVKTAVADRTTPRYAGTNATSLYLDAWVDWDLDLEFEDGPEHEIVAHQENPAAWADNYVNISKAFSPIDEHIMGNPLPVRVRLNYGGSIGTPDSAAAFGEVEDITFINYVEEFDIALHDSSPGIFMSPMGWGIVPDPDPMFTNHGAWHMAKAPHPTAPPCDGPLGPPAVMATPIMSWKEYTRAYMQFTYSHNAMFCGGGPDLCRVELQLDGGVVATKVIPIGTGTIVWDLSAHVGGPFDVQFDFISETDRQGWLFVDDVVIWAYDNELPGAVPNLAVSRASGTNDLALSWSTPGENTVVASPPADPVASGYQFRYSASPIGTDEDWRSASPFLPPDVLAGGAFPVPAVPGTPAAKTFEAPSAFQTYHVAMKAADENSPFSANFSNVPMVSTTPTITVSLGNVPADTTAPADTAWLSFPVSNLGNIQDLYELVVTQQGGSGWDVFFLDPNFPTEFPTTLGMLLDAQASSSVMVGVVPPGSASNGEQRTIQVVATSLADGVTSDSSATTVTVDAVTGLPNETRPVLAGLEFAAANPSRGTTAFRLALPSAQSGSVRVYDTAGRVVRTLRDGRLDEGAQIVSWDGRTSAGHAAPSGVYFLRVRSNDLDRSLRINLIR